MEMSWVCHLCTFLYACHTTHTESGHSCVLEKWPLPSLSALWPQHSTLKRKKPGARRSGHKRNKSRETAQGSRAGRDHPASRGPRHHSDLGGQPWCPRTEHRPGGSCPTEGCEPSSPELAPAAWTGEGAQHPSDGDEQLPVPWLSEQTTGFMLNTYLPAGRLKFGGHARQTVLM